MKEGGIPPSFSGGFVQEIWQATRQHERPKVKGVGSQTRRIPLKNTLNSLQRSSTGSPFNGHTFVEVQIPRNFQLAMRMALRNALTGTVAWEPHATGDTGRSGFEWMCFLGYQALMNIRISVINELQFNKKVSESCVMKVFVSILSVLLLSACANLLPDSREQTVQPWKSFDDAKASYDRIEPFVTDLDTVRKLGFDPFSTPNVKILNHAQVVYTVLPVPVHDEGLVPRGIRECIKAQEACQGYSMEPSRVKRERVGNFLLDFMNFKRETHTTGWKFGALIVVVGDRVVYKQWSGSPNIREEAVQRNPLGPLQGVGSSPSLYY